MHSSAPLSNGCSPGSEGPEFIPGFFHYLWVHSNSRLNRNLPYSAFDVRQFELLFKSHYKSLCAFANSFVHDKDTAEEIVQEVFINLWEKKSTIDQGKSVKSYLFTSVKNRCINHIRDHKKFRSYLLDVEIELEIPVEDRDQLAGDETLSRINQALDKLPPKCREVFELSRFEAMKYKQIAEKMAISVKTVEVQMSKALRILKEELGDLLFWLLILFLFR